MAIIAPRYADLRWQGTSVAGWWKSFDHPIADHLAPVRWSCSRMVWIAPSLNSATTGLPPWFRPSRPHERRPWSGRPVTHRRQEPARDAMAVVVAFGTTPSCSGQTGPVHPENRSGSSSAMKTPRWGAPSWMAGGRRAGMKPPSPLIGSIITALRQRLPTSNSDACSRQAAAAPSSPSRSR